MNRCHHGLPVVQVCEECQLEKDLGKVWRVDRKTGHGQLVSKDIQRVKVRRSYERAKRMN